jgi:hypothetical protein
MLKLNRRAFDNARQLVVKGNIVYDERDAWSGHRPSPEKENEFLRAYGFDEYGKWYLGIDDEKNPETKDAYEFPYGDFAAVHRCGVMSAESRAGQYKHYDIEKAAARIHGMIEELYAKPKQRSAG